MANHVGLAQDVAIVMMNLHSPPHFLHMASAKLVGTLRSKFLFSRSKVRQCYPTIRTKALLGRHFRSLSSLHHNHMMEAAFAIHIILCRISASLSLIYAKDPFEKEFVIKIEENPLTSYRHGYPHQSRY